MCQEFLLYNYGIMLKKTVICGLLLLSAVSVSSQPNQAAQHNENKRAQAGPASVVTPVPVEVKPESQQHQPQASGSTPAGNAAIKWPRWMSVPDWWLVIVALGTGIVIGLQSRETRRAAEAALESAKAANAQIKVMKDKDRARVAIEVLPLDTLEFNFGTNRVLLKVSNFGLTHALNVRAKGDARAVIFSQQSMAVALAGIYARNQHQAPEVEPLPFEFEDLGVSSVLRAGADPEGTWAAFIFPDEWEEVIAREPKIAIELRGIIDYEDVFGDPHSTKFSYDMRILRWGPLDSTGQAKIKPFSPFSHWFQSGGEDANKAT
jgi:hypothetical protein